MDLELFNTVTAIGWYLTLTVCTILLLLHVFKKHTILTNIGMKNIQSVILTTGAFVISIFGSLLSNVIDRDGVSVGGVLFLICLGGVVFVFVACFIIDWHSKLKPT